MIKLLFFAILFFNFQTNTYAQSCNAGTGFEVAALYQAGRTEEAISLKAKCTISKPASKKKIKKVYDCQKCVSSYQSNSNSKGRTLFEDRCKKDNKCLISYVEDSSWFLLDLNYSSTQILPCEDQMFCSDETKMCEYVCEPGFTYMLNSGMCEKDCSFDEIAVGDQCVKCGEGEVVNVDSNSCDCSAGTVRDNSSGICVPNCSSTETYEFPNGCTPCELGEISHENECVSPDLLCPIEGTEVTNYMSSWFGPDTYDCVCSDSNKELVGNNCLNKCDGNKVRNNGGECSCPSGMNWDEDSQKCVELNNNPSPCSYLGSNYMPYEGQSPYCQIPQKKQSYLFYDQANSTVPVVTEKSTGTFNPQISFNVSAEYIGCEKVRNSAVFKINYQKPAVPDYYTSLQGSIEVYGVCIDSTAMLDDFESRPFLLGSFDTSVPDINNYSKLSITTGKNCYKYRLFTRYRLKGITPTSTLYDIGDYDIPYETCQECPSGTVKINGECTCPAGLKMKNNICIYEDDCGTFENFISGQCSCNNPSGYTNFSQPINYRLIHSNRIYEKYSCSNLPQYSRNNSGVLPKEGVFLSAKIQNCSMSNGSSGLGSATIQWTGISQNGGNQYLYLECIDNSYRTTNYSGAYIGNDILSSPSFESNFNRLNYSFSGLTSGTFSIPIDGRCWNYRLLSYVFPGSMFYPGSFDSSVDLNIKYMCQE